MAGQGGSGQLPPWHLWGGTVPVRINQAVAGQPTRVTQQIAKISYGRPETWSFFLAGKVLNGTPNALFPTSLNVEINLMFGVGRSAFSTGSAPGVSPSAFLLLEWDWGVGITPGRLASDIKYTTQIQTPVLQDGVAGAFRGVISELPAQDIQVSAQATASSTLANVEFELTAFFAPKTHIRPDWYREDAIDLERFTGGEIKGT